MKNATEHLENIVKIAAVDDWEEKILGLIRAYLVREDIVLWLPTNVFRPPSDEENAYLDSVLQVDATGHFIFQDCVAEYVKALEVVVDAAKVIFDVASRSAPMCPHGNKPDFPTHAWWCNECFTRLQEALWGVEYERKKLEGSDDD